MAAVERGQVFFQALLDVVVMVPVARVDGDARAPRLDQPAGQQGPLAVEVPAIAVAQAGVFLRDVERLTHAVAGDHLQRLRLEGVEPLEHAAGVDVAAERVELPERGGAGPHRVEREALGERQVGDPEIGRVGVGPDLERVVRRPEVDRALVAERFRLGDRHIGGHVRRSRAGGAGDHRAERRLLRARCGPGSARSSRSASSARRGRGSRCRGGPTGRARAGP